MQSRNKREGLYMGKIGGHRRTHQYHASLQYYLKVTREFWPRPMNVRGTLTMSLPK